jgi:hypothetical protein
MKRSSGRYFMFFSELKETQRWLSPQRRFGMCSKEDFAVLSASLWCLSSLLSIDTVDSYPIEGYLLRLSTGVKNTWRFTHTSQFTVFGVCWAQGIQQLSTPFESSFSLHNFRESEFRSEFLVMYFVKPLHSVT